MEANLAESCSSCGSENKPGAKFCRGCGARLSEAAQTVRTPKFCVGCGEALKPGARFCRSCGRAVGAAVAAAGTGGGSTVRDLVNQQLISEDVRSVEAFVAPGPGAGNAGLEVQTAACAKCGAKVQAGREYCDACGEPVQESPASAGPGVGTPRVALDAVAPCGPTVTSEHAAERPPFRAADSTKKEEAAESGVQCQACGQTSPAVKKFCKSCGAPLLGEQAKEVPALGSGSFPPRSVVGTTGARTPARPVASAEPLQYAGQTSGKNSIWMWAGVAAGVLLLAGGGFAFYHWRTKPATGTTASQAAPAQANPPQTTETSSSNPPAGENGITPEDKSSGTDTTGVAAGTTNDSSATGSERNTDTAESTNPQAATPVEPAVRRAPPLPERTSQEAQQPAAGPAQESPASVSKSAVPIESTPVPQPATNSPSAASPAAPAREIPSSGVLIWSGTLVKNGTVAIDGSSATSGIIQGELPGVPVMLEVQSRDVGIAEFPGPSNGWKHIVLRSSKNGDLRVTIRWTVIR